MRPTSPPSCHSHPPPRRAPRGRITTAQYTPFTFLPAVLYFQFHPLKCFSNFYFACIGALQCISIISVTQGVPNQWGPLFLIVALDMVFIAFEDKSRHKADQVANAQPVDILRVAEDKVRRLASPHKLPIPSGTTLVLRRVPPFWYCGACPPLAPLRYCGACPPQQGLGSPDACDAPPSLPRWCARRGRTWPWATSCAS